MACQKCDDLKLYTIQEVAGITGLSRYTIAEIIRKGDLGFHPRGGRAKRIPGFELRRWMKEQMVVNGEAYKTVFDKRRKSRVSSASPMGTA
jgi:excisionase family DNA binding protein